MVGAVFWPGEAIAFPSLSGYEEIYIPSAALGRRQLDCGEALRDQGVLVGRGAAHSRFMTWPTYQHQLFSAFRTRPEWS